MKYNRIPSLISSMTSSLIRSHYPLTFSIILLHSSYPCDDSVGKVCRVVIMSLLGYPLRKAARYEMLSGGVRLTSLVQDPFPLKFTKSENIAMVSPREEREDMDLEYEHISDRMQPINVSNRIRTEMSIIRSADVYQRFLSDKNSKYHPRPRDLSIAPPESTSSRFMPLQMVKPIQSNWAPAVRGSGPRSTRGQLFQERLDQKGFGWKKKARSLWQQDIETNGFRPHRYF